MRWILTTGATVRVLATLGGCGGGGAVNRSYGNGVCYFTMGSVNFPTQCPTGRAAGSIVPKPD